MRPGHVYRLAVTFEPDVAAGRRLMLSRRIIPCLDVTAGRVVKGVHFQELRDAGDPVECASAYDAQGADELVFLDITASSDGRRSCTTSSPRTAEHCFMPLTVGGGLRSRRRHRGHAQGRARTRFRSTPPPSTNPGSSPTPPTASAPSASSWRSTPSASPARSPLAGLHPRRPQADRTRRRRLGRAGRGARRRRNPPHQHGPRRHPGRL